jgi:hypothetical protein
MAIFLNSVTPNPSPKIRDGQDDRKSIKENCDAFLGAVNADDPEMATILRRNWDALAAIVHEGQRDSKARGDFNAKVASALDALLAKPAAPKGKA